MLPTVAAHATRKRHYISPDAVTLLLGANRHENLHYIRLPHATAAATRTAPMNVAIKRVYDPLERNDGLRVLVDRLWPRGLSKDAAQIDIWAKELAPSHELRKAIGRRKATFLYASKAEAHNHAQLLKAYLETLTTK